jgi:hypothetical protein
MIITPVDSFGAFDGFVAAPAPCASSSAATALAPTATAALMSRLTRICPPLEQQILKIA